MYQGREQERKNVGKNFKIFFILNVPFSFLYIVGSFAWRRIRIIQQQQQQQQYHLQVNIYNPGFVYKKIPVFKSRNLKGLYVISTPPP